MYSSTTLEGPAKSGCWKQLGYSEQNADSLFPLEYRSYLGQAAHAVLQYCAERRTETEAQIRKTAEEVGNLLIREGREFRGRTEPPLPADDVWAGVEVAVNYVLARGLPLEAGIIIPEQDWVHPYMPFRALIDLVTVQDEGDEDYGARVCEVTDYKSSWQADQDELNSLQRWGQAVCVWRHISVIPDPRAFEIKHLVLADEIKNVDIIRQRVVNLRTWGEWTRDILLDDPDDVAELELWEKRIGELCETARGTVNPGTHERQANPGAGCLSCPYRHICEDAWPSDSDAWGLLSLEELAATFAQLEGQLSMLAAILKESNPEGQIPIQGGWVGYQEQSRRVLTPGAENQLLDDWLDAMAAELPEELMPAMASLLKSLNLKSSNLESYAKALYPQSKKGIKQIRDEYVAGVTDEARYKRFGVWKNNGDERP